MSTTVKVQGTGVKPSGRRAETISIVSRRDARPARDRFSRTLRSPRSKEAGRRPSFATRLLDSLLGGFRGLRKFIQRLLARVSDRINPPSQPTVDTVAATSSRAAALRSEDTATSADRPVAREVGGTVTEAGREDVGGSSGPLNTAAMSTQSAVSYVAIASSTASRRVRGRRFPTREVNG